MIVIVEAQNIMINVLLFTTTLAVIRDVVELLWSLIRSFRYRSGLDGQCVNAKCSVRLRVVYTHTR